ncbi:MFS transporter [Aspergillus nomiae NRRL 13137]|uniref:MFS transporter n=1 Tax=Aspergillus nomiae NRRL (strain ATCC 15546 / NRRL 13137 / CBS 260.88 / M93) TaxID=1509407 RepID=A0A0L1JCF9_ASPN3|nr:MFS transporter [Aspergillus nomiae NRRL 13137]KNG89118.1 MFS transporter [Aspergillus nomiae NRRL 13137]
MSLVQRVSAIDGVDNVDVVETASILSIPIRREISYDVLPPPPVEERLDTKAATPAYRVSTAKRLAQVIVTLLACWCASGIVFGFAALKPVMINEGVYRNLCTETVLPKEGNVCRAQDLRLNLFFMVGSITANVSALPVGTILDRYGSRWCGFIGCIALAAGSLLMAFSFSRGVDGYIAANLMLALGGTFIFVPSFRIANAFPKYTGTIVALVTGAFDASAAVYLFYRLAYEKNPGAYSPERFFLAYLAVPACILVALLTIMPTHDYQTTQQLQVKIEQAEDSMQDVHDSDAEIESNSELWQVRTDRAKHRKDQLRKIDKVFGDKSERKQRQEWEEERHETSRVWGVLHGLPAHAQMKTPWFILILLMTVLQMLRMNYFIATVRSQYEFMLHSERQAGTINDFFDVALPVGGVLSTPFIGLLLDNLSVPATLAVIVLLTTTTGVLNSVPAVWTGYLTVILFVLLRPYYYSAMSDYATKVFGFGTFGRVYGTIICFSGLVNFAQYLLDYLTHGPFHGNPIPINIFLATAGLIVGATLVTFVYIAEKRWREEKRAECDEERQRLIPEEAEEEQA